MRPIFRKEDLIKYGTTRLSGVNVPISMIKGFHQHDGMLESELEKLLPGSAVKLEQPNGREQLYFEPGTAIVHIPQYSGFSREYRYRRMIGKFIDASGMGQTYTRSDVGDSRLKTNQNYINFAYDLVYGLFMPEPKEKYEGRRVFPGSDISDVHNIIFGPTAAVARQARVIEEGRSEYLDAQLIDAGGEKILNLGYVYGDQAGRLIEKLLEAYDALAKDRGDSIPVSIYMFGRAGGLGDGLKRQSLVYPTGIVNSHDLFSGRDFTYPLDNMLVGESAGLTLNARSVLDETHEELAEAKRRSCVCVDMEAWESAIAIERAQGNMEHPPNFGYVCYVSDLPLTGDTLADELEEDSGEQAAVRVILDNIIG